MQNENVILNSEENILLVTLTQVSLEAWHARSFLLILQINIWSRFSVELIKFFGTTKIGFYPSLS